MDTPPHTPTQQLHSISHSHMFYILHLTYYSLREATLSASIGVWILSEFHIQNIIEKQNVSYLWHVNDFRYLILDGGSNFKWCATNAYGKLL